MKSYILIALILLLCFGLWGCEDADYELEDDPPAKENNGNTNRIILLCLIVLAFYKGKKWLILRS